MTDTCNAVGKDRGKNRICERPLSHDGLHRDGDYEWAEDGQIESNPHVMGRTGRELSP